MARSEIRRYPDLTQVTIFDLEFYVPPYDRPTPPYDFRANPFRDGHFLLGGVFLDWFPLRNPAQPPVSNGEWIWHTGHSERDLLERIYLRFRRQWALSKKRVNQCSPIVCGIGISRVDIGYLFSRLLAQEVAPADELFETLYHLRTIDLENAAIACFGSKSRLLYSKSTAELIQKFDVQIDRSQGSDVWELYESKDYDAIEIRTIEEVDAMYQIYLRMLPYLWERNLSSKYNEASFHKMIAGLATEDRKERLSRLFEREEDESGEVRWSLRDGTRPSEKRVAAELIFESGYWNG